MTNIQIRRWLIHQDIIRLLCQCHSDVYFLTLPSGKFMHILFFQFRGICILKGLKDDFSVMPAVLPRKRKIRKPAVKDHFPDTDLGNGTVLGQIGGFSGYFPFIHLFKIHSIVPDRSCCCGQKTHDRSKKSAFSGTIRSNDDCQLPIRKNCGQTCQSSPSRGIFISCCHIIYLNHIFSSFAEIPGI